MASIPAEVATADLVEAEYLVLDPVASLLLEAPTATLALAEYLIPSPVAFIGITGFTTLALADAEVLTPSAALTVEEGTAEQVMADASGHTSVARRVAGRTIRIERRPADGLVVYSIQP